MAKRDFIFIDEAGDPGEETPYFIQGLLHITDESLKKINVHLGAFRYFGNVDKELKSTKLNGLQKQKLLAVLKCAVVESGFVAATSVFVSKENYVGRYIKEAPGLPPKDATRFRHFMIRRLLEFHFKNKKVQSDTVEIIFDRIHPGEEKERYLKNYLRKLGALSLLPNFLHIIQVDSRYVELLQLTDWIAGAVKEKYFTHPERDFNDFFDYVKVKQIYD